MIRVQCSNCAKFLRVGPALAGRLVACPGCKSKLRVPARSDNDEAIVPAKQLPKPAPSKPTKASPVKAPGPARPKPPPLDKGESDDEERPARRARQRSHDDDFDDDDSPRETNSCSTTSSNRCGRSFCN